LWIAFNHKQIGSKRWLVDALAQVLPQPQGPVWVLGAWYGVLGPARMQPAHVNQMSTELAKTVALPDTREKLLALGIEPVGSTPERFAEHLRSEIARWTPIITKAGIKPD
ncbi:MAG: tripartite tricarboxylate transporter substrate-binding protein, partial [Pseudomonadota bacterium]